MRTYLAIAAVALITAGPVRAADWWLVDGEIGSTTAVFVDAESIARDGDTARYAVLTADVSGGQRATQVETLCGTDSDAAAKFACATDAQRMESAMMLGDMTPQAVATMLFSGRSVDGSGG